MCVCVCVCVCMCVCAEWLSDAHVVRPPWRASKCERFPPLHPWAPASLTAGGRGGGAGGRRRHGGGAVRAARRVDLGVVRAGGARLALPGRFVFEVPGAAV